MLLVCGQKHVYLFQHLTDHTHLDGLTKKVAIQACGLKVMHYPSQYRTVCMTETTKTTEVLIVTVQTIGRDEEEVEATCTT